MQYIQSGLLVHYKVPVSREGSDITYSPSRGRRVLQLHSSTVGRDGTHHLRRYAQDKTKLPEPSIEEIDMTEESRSNESVLSQGVLKKLKG
jgi:hypothetical protein